MRTRGCPPIPATPAALACRPSLDRKAELRCALLTTVDLLHRLRADLVSDEVIQDYVALDWLEWNGGSLRLTTIGTNVCEQLRSEFR